MTHDGYAEWHTILMRSVCVAAGIKGTHTCANDSISIDNFHKPTTITNNTNKKQTNKLPPQAEDIATPSGAIADAQVS